MSRIVIDSHGDIALQINPTSQTAHSRSEPEPCKTPDESPTEGAIELIVSSKILSIASPVLKVMLDGPFHESQKFKEAKNSTDSAQFPLELSEDHPDAMVLLCKLLHHQVGGIPEKPSPLELENLAFVCDKYQCAEALRFPSSVWLNTWVTDYRARRSKADVEDLSRLLVFAYVMDAHIGFGELAWLLLLHNKGPFLGPRTEAVVLIDHPLLRQDIGSAFDAKRFEFCQSYFKAIMAPQSTWAFASLTEGCLRASRAMTKYILELRRLRLIPHDLQFSDHSFHDLLDSVVGGSGIAYISLEQCRIYLCPCSRDTTKTMSQNLREEIDRIRGRKAEFGCLDCIKTEGRSKAEGTCRLKMKH